ncbi:hypothetical protein JTB14_004860 [Gonioctena quinquepunctata]|nr:hypothetical protein JTB14_004860 [Gonioctena quinquepunctata]
MVLVADLISFVSETLLKKISFDRVFAWTDSMIAISWIKASSYRWKNSVCNRVSHIQEKVSPEYWYHIDTKLNPADCASRGLLPSELLSQPLWFSGPTWSRWAAQDEGSLAIFWSSV